MRRAAERSKRRAIRQVFDELGRMTPTQLRNELRRHRNGNVAQLLLYAWYPYGLPEPTPVGPKKYMYMCAVDWAHEMGEVPSTELYGSVESLREHKSCVDECGIVMVEVAFNGWVQKGKL